MARESTLEDAVRYDPHGPHDLGAPTPADHGDPGVRVALDTTGGGSPPKVIYGVASKYSPPGGGAPMPAGGGVKPALDASKVLQKAAPDAGWGVFGRAVKD